MLYSSTMFKNMNSAGSSGLTPRQGTYLVGLVNFFASAMCVYVVNRFSRRFLLILGHIMIALTHAMVIL
jgi:hypothetical protein